MMKKIKKKAIASLIVFMLVFSNFATLGTALVSYAVEPEEDVNYSAQFVMINNTEEKNDSTDEAKSIPNLEAENGLVGNAENERMDEGQSETSIENSNEVNEANVTSVESSNEENETNATSVEISNETNTNSAENSDAEDESNVTKDSSNKVETSSNVTSETYPSDSENVENTNSEQVLQNGLAIEITVGVKSTGYLKNAKIDIKDLANQVFKLRDNISLGEYIQSIEDGKIKLRQINGGTEIKVYIPIELKNEETIDIARLQGGVELNLLGTHVDSEGNETIITKSVKPVLELSNDINLVVGSSAEKFIPYICFFGLIRTPETIP